MKCLLNVNFHRLEGAAHREPKALTLARKENTGQFLRKAEFAGRIVVIDQAERDIHDRHLNAKFDPDAGLKISQLVKLRVVNTQQ